MFNFKPVTRLLSMADYAPEYAGAEFHVWVNMPRAVMAALYQIQDDIVQLKNSDDRAEQLIAINQRVFEWYSNVFSQGDEASTHLSPAEVEQLVKHLIDIDPQAWPWLSMRVQEIIDDYRTAERKN